MLHFERAGEGEPLVLLHGIGSELCVWEPVLGALARRFDVIALDLPGFGRSAPLPGEVTPTPAALAAAVAGTLEAIGSGPVHAVGNSLGGWVALELGRTGAAASVTGLSPAGLWGRRGRATSPPTRSTARRLAALATPVLPALMRSERLRRLALMNVVGRPDRVPAAAAARMVASYGRAPAYEATSHAMRTSHLERASEIAVPVTIGWGERDRLLRPAPLRAPDVETHVLPGCGHVPTWDDPELVERLIVRGAARAQRSLR